MDLCTVNFPHSTTLFIMYFILATALFNALESKLPLDFKKKFGLSWNLVRASVGRERGKIKH